MENKCLICILLEKIRPKESWHTPTTANNALILGFWVASNTKAKELYLLCKEHKTIFDELDYYNGHELPTLDSITLVPS